VLELASRLLRAETDALRLSSIIMMETLDETLRLLREQLWLVDRMIARVELLEEQSTGTPKEVERSTLESRRLR
jgi:hypothetical protein